MNQELEISKMLTVSLSHLSDLDIVILKTLNHLEDEYSYITYTLYGDTTVDEQEIYEFNSEFLKNSKQLINLFQLARDNKCHWIRFDIDGPIIEGIPTNDL